MFLAGAIANGGRANGKSDAAVITGSTVGDD